MHGAQDLLKPEWHKALTKIDEEIGAPSWTADRRLANAAREAGAEFVHWIGGEGG
jgi:hypothetical protein